MSEPELPATPPSVRAFTVVPKQADIVDAQIHIGPGGIEAVLAAMNAVGVTAALVDEYWLAVGAHDQPHHPLPDGVYRSVSPTAELAAQLYPSRFSWLRRVNRLDPEYRAVIRMVRDAPGGRALRIDPGISRAEMRCWAEGGYDHIFAIAADWDLPVFVFAPDLPEAFTRAAKAFPKLRIGIDHCGLISDALRGGGGNGGGGNGGGGNGGAYADGGDGGGRGRGGGARRGAAAQVARFDRIRALADLPNLTLKWGHASTMFDRPVWPGDGLWPLLRGAVDAFGAGRVFWESDYSANGRGESWAELLFGVRGCPLLTEAERAEVLGGALRRWLSWPRE